MKKIMHKMLGAVLALLMIIVSMPSALVSAATDEFSGIEFYTIEMRYDDSVTEEDYLSGVAATMGIKMWNNYLVVPAYFSKPKDANDRNQIFVYDMSSGSPVFSAQYNMADLGMVQRTGSYAKPDIISGIHITDDYLFVSVYVQTGWPDWGYNCSDTLYIYENPFKGINPSETLTRVKINDQDIYSGKVSDRITFGYNWSLYSDRPAQMSTVGNNLITFQRNHNITESSGTFSVADISGETVSVTYKSEYEILKTINGTNPSRFCDVVFEGNEAYVLVAEEGASANETATLNLLNVDFTDPLNPIVISDCAFDSNYLYSDLGYLGANITIEDGYAYISTYGRENKSATGNIDKCPHIFTLRKTGSSFEFVKDFQMSSEMTLSGGFGCILVVDDIAVCLNGPSYKNSVTYLQFNETKDEIVSFKKGGNINTDSSANCTDGVRYGSKLIFGLMQTGVVGGTDTNKAVVDIFDVLSKGIEFDNTNRRYNSINESVYAEFENPYVTEGINTIHIEGKNIAEEVKDIQIIFGVYKNDALIKTSAGAKHQIQPGEAFDFDESIDLTEIDDLNGVVIKAFIWENTDAIRPLAQVCSPPEVGFSFTLDEAASTSAGVYDENGTLIRTLWSSVDYDAGTHKTSWDGKDDYGNYVPDGDYRIDVLSNNVAYKKFVDVIGNNSDCSSWDTFISSYCSIFDMAYDDKTDRLYYCSNHVEGGYGLRYLNADNLHITGALLDGFKANMTAVKTAVDDNRIYWASEEIQMKDYGNKGYKNFWSFIYATDDTGKPYAFEYGEAQASKWSEEAPNGTQYPYAINRQCTPFPALNRITGLEVQQTGNLLFSSYMDMNAVYVNDKNTGELLYTYETAMPGGIALQGEDILWIAEQNEDKTYSVKKYSVGNDGTLTYADQLDKTFKTILSMAVSPSGDYLAVIEGDDSDKLYVFDTETKNLYMSYGSSESYITDPTVKDDKLMFDDFVFSYPGIYEHSFVEFMSDTELLLGDSGNTRVLKLDISHNESMFDDSDITPNSFTESFPDVELSFDDSENTRGFNLDISGQGPKITDSIMFQYCSYSTYAVSNDITRIFSEKKEYSIDYEKVEQYVRGEIPFEDTWKFENNYALMLYEKYPELGGSIEALFDNATKLSNGVIYFRMTHNDGKQYLYFLDGKDIENTGMDVTNKHLHEDGSLWYKQYKSGICYYYKNPLIGFDENKVPIYGDAEPLAEIASDAEGITPYNGNVTYSRVPITDSGKIISLNAMGPTFVDTEKVRMHLGAIDISSGYNDKWEWMAAPSTLRAYSGFFPRDGYFNIAANVQYTAKNPFTFGNNVIFHYRGEGLGEGQSNIFYHFSDGGLLVGVFGRNNHEYGGSYEVGGSVWSGSIEDCYPCNSMCVTMVQSPVDSDVAYIFQNTEGAAGGVHMTRVTGLDSIKLQSTDVSYKKALISGIKYTCYNDAGFDSACIEKCGVTNTFDIPCIKENDGNHSVRFEGYFKAEHTGRYRFAVDTDGIVGLWIDGKHLIGGKTGTIGSYLNLNEGITYDFKLEISPGENGLSYLDVGYMSGISYLPLDAGLMCCEYPGAADKNHINLLDGLEYGKEVKSGKYGWETAIYNGNSDTILSLNAARWNYRRDGDSDIEIKMGIAKNPGTTYNEIHVDRSLGEVNSENWIIDMDLRFTGTLTRGDAAPGRTHGTVVEVLDKDDNIIANFYFTGGALSTEIRARSNGQLLCTFPKPVQNQWEESVPKFIDVKINLPQNLRFYVENGQIAVEYYGERVVVPAVDENADIYAPAKVRFLKYNSTHGLPYTSTLNITRFNITK